jgi:serine/threonine protein phosphatase 1
VLNRLFGRSGKKARGGPAGLRAYAIGDVHGRLDLLEELLAAIERDNASRPPARTWLIFLGDLVDRGPDSRGVVEHLLHLKPSFAQTVFLQGNHEEFLLRVLAGEEDVVTDWLTYGGLECAESYGVSRGWTLNATPGDVARRLQELVPDSHRTFLSNMADTFRFGDYLFVHAGIRPGVPIAEQSAKDLRWIREGFLESRADHGLVVVHGHTIVDEPEEHANRIAVDTGAYRHGVLTAVGLEGTERWFIQAREPETQAQSSRAALAS